MNRSSTLPGASALLLSSLMLLFVSTPTKAHAYEAPKYKVLETNETYEIREYEPYIVAETVISEASEQAGRQGFKILAGYIFGANKAKAKMQMTTPVTTARTNVKMNMTVPVTTQRSGKAFVMQFVMESKYTLDTLPTPNDSRVRLKQIPKRVVAVHRFSGPTNEKNFAPHTENLLAALDADSVAIKGTPYSAVYDGPWTLPWKRHNEILVEISYSRHGSKAKRTTFSE